MRKYKINLHSHSYFSDGKNSPYKMALKAKELGFSALVITDHFYGSEYSDDANSLNTRSYGLLKYACEEAKEILPVIVGIEAGYCGQEVLVFGQVAINKIFENGKLTKQLLNSLRISKTFFATILCHPGSKYSNMIKDVDGYERINSAQDFFSHDDRIGDLDTHLNGRVGWCNSDAHSADRLSFCWNLVGKDITTEDHLIKYIKSKQHPEHFINTKHIDKLVAELKARRN